MNGSLSVVLPFRNEEEVITELVRRLHQSLKPLEMDYELIFINDASTDCSLTVLKELSRTDGTIRVINMSRRFGNEECVLAGMGHAKGCGVVVMDTDLQDPPELIPQLVEKWLAGADVVYTVRMSREGESWLKVLITKWAYQVLRFVTQMNLPVEAGNFKLMSRQVVDELLKFNEKSPLVRALVNWVGFKQVPVFYHRAKRLAGKTHFPILRSTGPVKAFFSGILAFSTAPLILFFLAGLAVSCSAFAYLGVTTAMFFIGNATPGWNLAIAAFLFLWGIQWTGMGIMGLYLGRIYEEVKNRPRTIIASTIGFEEESTDSRGLQDERPTSLFRRE